MDQVGLGYGTGSGGYREWEHCPYCGAPLRPDTKGPGYGRGPGMRPYNRGEGPGYWRGPGMMHRDWDWGRQYGPRPGWQYQEPQKPLEEKDAKEMLENYFKSTRNPNLKLGNIEEKDRISRRRFSPRRTPSRIRLPWIRRQDG